MKNGKCVLLDRDGVLNVELGDYVYSEEQFVMQPDVPAGLQKLKESGFSLVVVTNQGGISKGMYSNELVIRLHNKIQKACGNCIDFLLYAPWHINQSKSLSAKPGSLMVERGLALTKASVEKSWLIGDAERDLIAAKAVSLKTILIPTLKEKESPYADFVVTNFEEAVATILEQSRDF